MTISVYITPKGQNKRSISSDQLAGALIDAMSKIYGQETVLHFLETDAITTRISSSFPYILDSKDKRVCFFPKPMIPIKFIGNGSPSRIKLYKKTTWIHEELFNRIISGKITIEEMIKSINVGKTGTKSTARNDNHINYSMRFLYPSSSMLAGTMIYQDTYHNLVDRYTNTAIDPYFSSGWMYYNAGQFFLIDTSQECWKILQGCLRYLADTGIGKRISSGNCQVDIDWKKNEIKTKVGRNETKKWVLLSFYVPTKDEWDSISIKESYYSIEIRNSRSSDGNITNAIAGFTAGSVLTSKKPLGGQIIRLNSQKKQIRWGKAMTIPLTG